jgi:ADP-heptose:LPS heptosyltransferase
MNKFKRPLIYIGRILYFLVQKFLFNKRSCNPENIKNILIVRLNHIGDLFISLSSIFSLKEKFPEAKITLVTGTWNKGLAEFQNQLFDNVYYYNLNKNCRNKSLRMPLRQRKEILKALRKKNLDLCVDFDGSWEFLFLYIFSKIKYLSTARYLRFYQNLEQLKLAFFNFKLLQILIKPKVSGC